MPAIQVPLLDTKAQYRALREDLLRAIDETLASGQWILGPRVEELERELARRLGTAHAVAVASGTDALVLALKALKIGSGDEVVLPSFTFFATAGAVVNAGATPVFAEMEEDSWNLDPVDLAGRLTPRTRAVIAVHLFGQTANLAPILEVAGRRGVPVIEDAAQAIGATFGDQPVGGIGALGCFSFYPTKNLGAAGDGGLVTSQDSTLADRVVLLRNHGMRPRYLHHEVGTNSRLDAIQAAILRVKLDHLEAWSRARRAHAEVYDAALAKLDVYRTPKATGLGRHVYNQYCIRVRTGSRDALRSFLGDRGIGSEIYYPVPLHMQPCFRHLGYEEGQFPLSEAAARDSLALPVYPEMSEEQQAWVIASLAEWARAV